jgi:hypothetical protein
MQVDSQPRPNTFVGCCFKQCVNSGSIRVFGLPLAERRGLVRLGVRRGDGDAGGSVVLMASSDPLAAVQQRWQQERQQQGRVDMPSLLLLRSRGVPLKGAADVAALLGVGIGALMLGVGVSCRVQLEVRTCRLHST